MNLPRYDPVQENWSWRSLIFATSRSLTFVSGNYVILDSATRFHPFGQVHAPIGMKAFELAPLCGTGIHPFS